MTENEKYLEELLKEAELATRQRTLLLDALLASSPGYMDFCQKLAEALALLVKHDAATITWAAKAMCDYTGLSMSDALSMMRK